MYIVVCEDGAIRHASPFGTQEEARIFAEFGHCCTADHIITGVDFAEHTSEVEFAVSRQQIDVPASQPQNASWVPASELRADDIILLPFGRSVKVKTINWIGDYMIQFVTADDILVELRTRTNAFVERRN